VSILVKFECEEERDYYEFFLNFMHMLNIHVVGVFIWLLSMITAAATKAVYPLGSQLPW